MNIEIDNRLCRVQRYSCLNCGHGCRSFMVPVNASEREKIANLEDWCHQIGEEDLFVDLPQPGFEDGALAKHPDRRCIFLDNKNLCLIHSRHSLSAKPVACQLFPFVLTPFNGKLLVGLRFDCPGVCRAEGDKLTDNITDLKRLAKLIYPDGLSEANFAAALPAICGKQKADPTVFNKINDTIINRFTQPVPKFRNKIWWLSHFAGHLEKVNFRNLSSDDLPGLLSLLSDGTAREAEKELVGSPLPHRPRVLFGQYLYLLGRQPEVITTGATTGLWQRFKSRLNNASDLRRMGHSSGLLPVLHEQWRGLDIAQVENGDFGAMPDEAAKLLERYILARLTGHNYCGLNYYRYSMTDGLFSLSIVVCAINWLARVNAVIANRTHLEYLDFEKALILADSNNGYGSALNSGTAGLRLKYLKSYIKPLVSNYVSD